MKKGMVMLEENKNHTRKRIMTRQGLNPFPWYEHMRRSDPIHFDPDEQGWDIFRYQDVKQILLAPSLYSSRRVEDARDFISLDPPRHTQLRAVVAQAFTQCQPDENRIKPLITALLDKGTSGRLDLIADLALPLPILVIAETLG